MPLPSALAARLIRRGLIFKSNEADESEEDVDIARHTNVAEEVIAENYDNQENQGSVLNIILNKSDYEDSDEELSVDNDLLRRKFLGHYGCPNKSNVFHECTLFCKEYWRDGFKEPDPKYMRKKAAMLKKYPLPSHWKEIYDPGTGRHYYWETDSDSVSWLPPSHPKAIISESAANLREEQLMNGINNDNSGNDQEDDEKDEKSDLSSEEEIDKEVKRREEKKRRKEDEERKRAKGRIKSRENDLDPMDPASYSDIPRGGWSEGLVKGNEAKTGVDVTAPGPLYQMRPYPNPGAVLRANAKTTTKKGKPNEDEDSD